MRVLILGMDGYLGWPLALRLAAQGHEVSGMDNLFTRKAVAEVGSDSGVPILSPKARLEAARRISGAKMRFYSGDVTDYKSLAKVLKKEKPDAVVHFAEQRSAPYSMIDQGHAAYTMSNNIVGTINLIYAIRKSGRKTHLLKMGCYGDDTEVLTRKGWKRFQELEYSDEVCCLDPASEEIVYSAPTHIVKYPYKGNMLNISTTNLDFLVTPNHRVVYRNTGSSYAGGMGPIRIGTAEEVYGKNFAVPKTGAWGAQDTESFELPELSVRSYGGAYVMAQAMKIKMDRWLSFFGWYVSEGCVRYRGDQPTAVYISQKSTSAKLPQLRKAVQDLGLNFVETVHQDKRRADTVMVTFEISNNHLANYLARFGKSGEKYLPAELKNLGARQLRILFEALMLGDGHVNPDTGSMYYYSKSPALLSDMQELSIKLGYGATICTRAGHDRTDESYLCISKSRAGFVESAAQSWVPYDGFVYCCTVPSGIIMVRRNGKASFSGNTMGEFGTPNFDIPETAYVTTKIGGREDTITVPKWAGSWYHWTKVHDTNNILFANKLWGVTSTDIMQGPVYGLRTSDIKDPKLFTRFDFDGVWGTVLNRYCVEAILGVPLTQHGQGGQVRGFLSLEDSMHALTLLLEHPPIDGEYRAVNQFRELHSVAELARFVQEVGNNMGLGVEIKSIPNPRVEKEQHYYKVESRILPSLGFNRLEKNIKDEIATILEDLAPYKGRLEKYRKVIMPSTWWR